MICYLCLLGHPADRLPVHWRVDCTDNPITGGMSVYTCASHYGEIVTAAGPRAVMHHLTSETV